MPLLENLVGGLGAAAGSQSTVDLVNQKKSDRRATQQEELHGRTKAILDDVAILQDRRSKLPPGSPEIASIDKALREHQQAFTDLYHPTKNPGALQHLGGFLKQHLTGKAPTPAPPSNAVTPERMAGLQSSAAGTAQPEQNPYVLKVKALEAAGVPHDEAVRLATGQKDPASIHRSDYAEGLRRFVTAEGGDPDNPTAAQEEAYRKSRATASHVEKKRYAWKKLPNGKFASVELDEKNQIVPGTENTEIQPPAGFSGSVTTGQYHFIDDKGNVHSVEETRTRTPLGGGTDAGSGSKKKVPSVPATAGEAKTRVAANAPKDKVLGHKDTPVQSKARKDVTDATKLASIADQVEKNPNDAVNQKRLAVALERISAGRFTTQALDYIIKAGWGNTLEQWANNPTTGALPKDVMRQLVDGAHQNLKASQDALKESLEGAIGQESDDDKFLKQF